MGLESRIRDLGSGKNLFRILDPGVTVSHALSLPPPGIEPGSPVSQAGTLPKELSRQLILWVVGATHLTAREGSNLPPPPQNLPQPVEISITIQHNRDGGHEQLISNRGRFKPAFAERDNCKPVLLGFSLARNLVKPLLSLYGTEWRERGYGLSMGPTQ